MDDPTCNLHVATSATNRDAQPNEAGSRSYGTPNAPKGGPEFKDKEDSENEEDMSEDEVHEEESSEESDSDDAPRPAAGLPEIPTLDDLKFDLDAFSFMTPTSEVQEKVHKRASNVLKLTQENEKLQARLKAMAEQLEGMERLRAQLAAKEQKVVERASSSS